MTSEHAGSSRIDSSRESAIRYEGEWWRALDGEPVEGPFATPAEVEAVIQRLGHLRAGAAARAGVCGTCGNKIDRRSYTQCCGAPS